MVYKRFRINCILRVLLLSATVYLFFYLLFRTTLYVTFIIVGSAVVYQIYSLIHFIEKTNRDLSRFLEAVRYADFSQSFSAHGLGASFEELQKSFTEVISEFQRTRTEKEEHFRYLQTVVQHIGIGLISYQQNGEVELINDAAKKLLKINQLKNIKTLESYSKKLVKTMFKLTAGEKALVKVDDSGELLQLAIYASQFKLRGQKFTLVSLQNIQSELEEKEMEAWQNLIRVLTHEIMNSVTPIASLASTVNDLLTESPNQEKPIERIDTEIISDVRGALQTIEKRSHGLLNFVDAYRNLTRIPRPNLQIVSLSEFFSRLKKLMHSQITEGSIDLQVHIEPDNLQLAADPELIEQVLINLLLNAIEAVAKQPNPVIKIFAKLDDKGRITIQVIDNGTGISEEIAEKIFIPFFTTKKKGSGIGLSLSRQIMRMHRGSLGVLSKKGETVFTLKF